MKNGLPAQALQSAVGQLAPQMQQVFMQQ